MIYTLEDKYLISKATSLAMLKHADQAWGFYPYSVHLDRTAQILKQYGYGSAVYQAAAWLHDILEDTDITLTQLTAYFPIEVVRMVAAVSDPAGLPNRKARKAAVYDALDRCPEAIPVKVADRLVNVKNALLFEKKFIDMYHKENRVFVKRLAGAAKPLVAVDKHYLQIYKMLGDLEGLLSGPLEDLKRWPTR